MTTANEPDQRFAETPQADESDSFTVAYYFLPLERPLSLDEKRLFAFQGGVRVSSSFQLGLPA